MNIISKLEKKEIFKMNKKNPIFFPGNIIKITFKIIENKKKKIHFFEGIVISKKNKGFNSTFTLRRIIKNECIDKLFFLYSPLIINIKIINSMRTRLSKLYYLKKKIKKNNYKKNNL